MNFLPDLLRTLAHVFFAGLWQGAILIAAVAVALRLCSRVGPQFRFAVWGVAFIVLLAAAESCGTFLFFISRTRRKGSAQPDLGICHRSPVGHFDGCAGSATRCAFKSSARYLETLYTHSGERSRS
jgi:hypothetical protein